MGEFGEAISQGLRFTKAARKRALSSLMAEAWSLVFMAAKREADANNLKEQQMYAREHEILLAAWGLLKLLRDTPRENEEKIPW